MPQTVMTVSTGSVKNSLRCLEWWLEISRPISCIALMAEGVHVAHWLGTSAGHAKDIGSDGPENSFGQM